MTIIKLTYPKGTKVKFTDPAYKGLEAVVLGTGDKDFEEYGVLYFDYLIRLDDPTDDDLCSLQRAYSHEIVSI